MQYKRTIFSLRQNAEGASAIEFVIVATVFFFMMFVVIELGMYMFSRSVVESAATMASRAASIASQPYPFGCGDRICVARETARKKAGGLARANQMSFTMDLLSQGAPPTPEYCIDEGEFCDGISTNCIPGYAGGNIADTNGNGVLDCTSGSNGAGGGETVIMTIQYPYRLFIPIPMIQSLFGTPNGNILIIKSTTVIKNEAD